ncbi:hypothetical protein QC763_408715 [Podospora pseudopauciseta]|uniref:Uncharacterized protein n=1 Tax=Podospora pseudopauciseta TaxID=2093780 RepID=A0ABR0HDD6_9PEZI|nr:hypothetical protein QC763_408715 [Podospora pseudopauciseta]
MHSRPRLHGPARHTRGGFCAQVLWILDFPARDRSPRETRPLGPHDPLRALGRRSHARMLSRGELADEPVRLAVLKQLLEAVTKLDWYSKIRSMGNGAMFSPGNIFVNSKNGSMKLISFRDVELLGYFEGFEESDDDDDPGPYWIPKAWAEKPQSAARWLIDTFVDSSDYRRPTNHYRF